MSDLMSRLYPEHLTAACERCIFGRGDHAEWCPERQDDVQQADPEETTCSA